MPKNANPIKKVTLPSGKEAYEVRLSIRLPGEERRQVKRQFERIGDARTFVAQIRAEEATGVSITSSRQTLKAWLLEWHDLYVKPKLRPQTVVGYKGMIDRYLSPYLGLYRLEDLSSNAIQAAYNKMAEKGLAYNTVRYAHRVLNRAIKKAVEIRRMKFNPCDAVEIVGRLPVKTKAMEREEALAFLDALSKTDLYVSVILGEVQANRRGEMLGLRWPDVNLDTGRYRIENQRQYIPHKGTIDGLPKSENSEREGKFPTIVLEALRAEKKKQQVAQLRLGPQYYQSDYICRLADGRPITPNYFPKLFKNTLISLGITPVQFRVLRKTCLTLLANTKAPVKGVSAFAGHSSIDVTMDIYAEIQHEGEKAVTDQLEKIFSPKSAKKVKQSARNKDT